jgi:hypothetical protein
MNTNLNSNPPEFQFVSSLTDLWQGGAMRFRTETDSYECALRAIGQDLEVLVIDSLEITSSGEAFDVQAICHAPRAPARTGSSVGFFQRARSKVCLSGSAVGELPRDPVLKGFSRVYGPQDIARLDEIGKSRRTGIPTPQNVSSLSNELRSVGRAIDSAKGQLVKLVKNQGKLAFEYHDEKGALHRAEHSRLESHRSQQDGVSFRGKKKLKDAWEGRDR